MHKLAAPADPMIFFYATARGGGAGSGFAAGFMASAFQADGSYHAHWGIYAGGTFEPGQ